MSAYLQPRFAIATMHLSADGTTVHRGEENTAVDLAPEAAVAAMGAFGRLTAMDLVDVEAKIYLTGPRAKVAVQNVGGRLFVTAVPEAVNTATERTPEQILEMVALGKEAPTVAETQWNDEGAEGAATAAAKRGASAWSAVRRSPWTLAVLAVTTLVMAYATFGPAMPAGVEVIHDPAKTAALHGKLNGRYGLPSGTILVLNGGKLTGVRGGQTAGNEEKVFELSYRFGLRGEQVVVLVSNGALLEQRADGGLKFLESVYPRATK